MTGNIQQDKIIRDFPKWDESNPERSLENILAWVINQAEDNIQWYAKKIPWKKRPSQIFRALAILFSAIGGLIPLAGATRYLAQYEISNWGFVFIGIAVAFVGADKYFGLSTGWIRYIKTQMALERGIRHLKMDWARLRAAGAASEHTAMDYYESNSETRSKFDVEKHMDLLISFLKDVSALVQKETEDWAQEFHNRLIELGEIGRN